MSSKSHHGRRGSREGEDHGDTPETLCGPFAQRGKQIAEAILNFDLSPLWNYLLSGVKKIHMRAHACMTARRMSWAPARADAAFERGHDYRLSPRESAALAIQEFRRFLFIKARAGQAVRFF